VSDLPSWVPDLRPRASMYAFERYLDVDDFSSTRAYNAGSTWVGSTTMATIDGHRLRVHGYCIYVTETVYPECYHNLATGGLEIERK
jgi:hypothetical protein